MTTVAIWSHPWTTPNPKAPSRLPLSAAAQRLAADGISVVFAHRLDSQVAIGVKVVDGQWQDTEERAQACWDRFPSQTFPARWLALQSNFAGPLGNPPSLTLGCRDKLATQQIIEASGVRMPEVASDPATFAAQLDSWGSGFAKPRHGALGRGVRKVRRGQPVDAHSPGAVPGTVDATLLQRAIVPWGAVAGQAVRALVQREPSGRWVCPQPVVRVHDSDPVANVARGARVLPSCDAFPLPVHAQVVATALQVAEVLGADPLVLELGVDLVVDEDGLPWVIEVNASPRGRLAVLAALDPTRWSRVHEAACERPIRRLAALVAQGSPEAS